MSLRRHPALRSRDRHSTEGVCHKRCTRGDARVAHWSRAATMSTEVPAISTITPATASADLAALAAEAGLKRIHVLAWRDLDDVEAGGSELHASRVAARWAEAGLEVTMRTSH